ncbi:MAG: gentisate 1,2-dioxygenase [Acidimicrobiaceae bacterium]|nr:gentisate 1,2-dioxygenase [Acidimicrobiaceae bacterium]
MVLTQANVQDRVVQQSIPVQRTTQVVCPPGRSSINGWGWLSVTDIKLDWDTLSHWSKGFPFRPGERQVPRVIPRRSIPFSSWGPDPEGRHRTPCWIYTSTQQIGFVCTMSVAPGDFFENGNHPNVETYYQMSGTLHVQNADTGEVVEIRPGDGFVMPAFEYHIGHNFSTEESLTLCCVPGESHTQEFRNNPILAENYTRNPVTLFGESTANEGFPSQFKKLAAWPAPTHAIERGKSDFVPVPRSDWLNVVLGADPRYAVLASFYYSSPQLAAYSVTVPPNRISQAHAINGETVIYVRHRDLIIDVLDTGESLYAEEGDAVFIPPGVRFQYQNRGDKTIEVMVFSSPWEPATLFPG